MKLHFGFGTAGSRGLDKDGSIPSVTGKQVRVTNAGLPATNGISHIIDAAVRSANSFLCNKISANYLIRYAIRQITRPNFAITTVTNKLMKSEYSVHPINFVARMTGLSTHLIRIWERRYGVVRPTRTKSGHRRYSDRDIERLRLLKRAVQQGHPIGKIAWSANNELRELILERKAGIDQTSGGTGLRADESAQFLAECKEAVAHLDRARLEQTLVLAGLNLTPIELVETLIHPLMGWVGDQWRGGYLCIAHEHLAAAAVRGFLENLRRPHRAGAESQRITLTTPTGNRHDLGALCLAVVAAEDGWQDFFFGPDMPAIEIARAARHTNSQAIALSVVMQEDDRALREELATLRQLTSRNKAIIVGGPGAAGLRDYLKRTGLVYAANIAEFRACLRGLVLRGDEPRGSQSLGSDD